MELFDLFIFYLVEEGNHNQLEFMIVIGNLSERPDVLSHLMFDFLDQLKWRVSLTSLLEKRVGYFFFSSPRLAESTSAIRLFCKMQFVFFSSPKALNLFGLKIRATFITSFLSFSY